MLTIANCHYESCDFYCGRDWKGYPRSPLANPFKGPDAIKRFANWLWAQIQAKNMTVLEALNKIQDEHWDRVIEREMSQCDDAVYALGCWCKPKECHCTQIILAIQCPEVIYILAEVFAPF